MTKRRVKTAARRSFVLLFSTMADLRSGERLLRSRAGDVVICAGPPTDHPVDPGDVVRVGDVAGLRTWLRSSRRSRASTTLVLGLESHYDLHNESMAALASMGVHLPQVLSSGQDQIFVLDRNQRMVAFFGHWPKESPRRPQDMLGKRKRDVFGADIAAVHEAAGLRALNGEEAVFEWSVVDAPRPVHLLTAASPLLNDTGEVAGILLVTRNITQLKQMQLETERTLQQQTDQLVEIERGMKQVAAALQPALRGRLEDVKAGGSERACSCQIGSYRS